MEVKSTGCHDCKLVRTDLKLKLPYCALMSEEAETIAAYVENKGIPVECPLKASNCTIVLYQSAVVPYATAKLYEDK